MTVSMRDETVGEMKTARSRIVGQESARDGATRRPTHCPLSSHQHRLGSL